jgi:IS5 family transposase
MIFCRNKCVFVYYIHLSCNKKALPVRLQVREKQNLSPSLRVLKQNQTFLAGGEYRKTENEKESKERKKKHHEMHRAVVARRGACPESFRDSS